MNTTSNTVPESTGVTAPGHSSGRSGERTRPRVLPPVRLGLSAPSPKRSSCYVEVRLLPAKKKKFATRESLRSRQHARARALPRMLSPRHLT